MGETIKKMYSNSDRISLHEPTFLGNEKTYLNEYIDTTLVSSVGKLVDTFELKYTEYTGSKYVVVTTNAIVALHVALKKTI